MQTEWFKEWFDSEYYHLLYNNRNHTEAEQFIQKLAAFLKLAEDSKVLDLACGKGRHSISLSKYYLHVTGLDISANSICYAKQFENEKLHFAEHDMRLPFGSIMYNAVFNLFTSFGYFNAEYENLKVLRNIHASLKVNGIFVLDFLNAELVKNNLVANEQQVREGVTFDVERKISNGQIIKDISFEACNSTHQFQEKVQYLTKDKLVDLLTKSGFEILNIFGNYNLEEFSVTSSRCILIAKKCI